MPYRSSEFMSGKVTLGEFQLSQALIGKINNFSALPVEDLADIGDIPDAAFHGDGIYIGANPSSPQIGDLRVRYQIVMPTDVSIVAGQIGASFEPYRTRAGGAIHMLKTGLIGADNMFQQAHESNKMWTWILRFGGFIIMLIGVAMILRPLSVVADVIPFVGNIVGAGTGILSFLIAAPFAFLTIAVAWLRYRPLIGIVFLVLAAVVAGLVFILSKRAKASTESSPAGTVKARKMQGSTNVDPAMPARPTDVAAAGMKSQPQNRHAGAGQEKVTAMLKMGQQYFQAGQYARAVKEFSRVIKSGGNQNIALYNRGVALFKLNKKDAARNDFKYAAKLGNPKAKAILSKIDPGAV